MKEAPLFGFWSILPVECWEWVMFGIYWQLTLDCKNKLPFYVYKNLIDIRFFSSYGNLEFINAFRKELLIVWFMIFFDKFGMLNQNDPEKADLSHCVILESYWLKSEQKISIFAVFSFLFNFLNVFWWIFYRVSYNSSSRLLRNFPFFCYFISNGRQESSKSGGSVKNRGFP